MLFPSLSLEQLCAVLLKFQCLKAIIQPLQAFLVKLRISLAGGECVFKEVEDFFPKMSLIQLPDLDVLIVELVDQIAVSFVFAHLLLEIVHFLVVMRPALFGRLIQQPPNFHKKVSLLLVGVQNVVIENEGEVVMKVF